MLYVCVLTNILIRHIEHPWHVHNLDVNEYLDFDDDNDEMQCQETRFQSRSSVDTKLDDYGKQIT